MKKVCVITDNEYLYLSLKEIVKDELYSNYIFDFYFSDKNIEFNEKYQDDTDFRAISLKLLPPGFFEQYCLFLSLHCKQIFPKEMVEKNRCINIHPGYNPYNRGWFPQVFSIINKMPVGVTIHEMDEELDHGPVIYQETVEVYEYDTSKDVYERILQKEIELIDKFLINLIESNYCVYDMVFQGNINYQEDFKKLCCIDLDSKATFREMIDLLRALTFDKYDNAYFLDKNGNKVYLSIALKSNLK